MSAEAENEPGRGEPYEPCLGMESVYKKKLKIYVNVCMHAYKRVYVCMAHVWKSSI